MLNFCQLSKKLPIDSDFIKDKRVFYIGQKDGAESTLCSNMLELLL